MLYGLFVARAASVNERPSLAVGSPRGRGMTGWPPRLGISPLGPGRDVGAGGRPRASLARHHRDVGQEGAAGVAQASNVIIFATCEGETQGEESFSLPMDCRCRHTLLCSQVVCCSHPFSPDTLPRSEDSQLVCVLPEATSARLPTLLSIL